jgi:Archaeal/vacuolar-type H+-ATPase subunit C
LSKKKKTDYLFLSANLRARENRLLDREKLNKLVDAADFSEAAKILTDCGYPELNSMTDAGLEQVFSDRREALFAEVENLSPEPAIVTAFRLKYDYHNAKVLVKAEGAGVDGQHILSASGRVAPEKLIKAYTEDNWRDVPQAFAAAVREAKSTLARTANPQLADIGLDKAYFAEFLNLTSGLSDTFLLGYGRLGVDVANLRAAVRCVRSHMDASILSTALIAGGNIDAERIRGAANSPDDLTAVFSNGPLAGAAELGAAAIKGAKLSAFELECDNILIRYLAEAKMVSFGPEPVEAFLASIEGEIVAVRMVLLGKRNGVTPDMLRERLRDCYV